ncbi:aldehyde dehydrogenase family protein [Halobellus captivus]|uniref:aldehyde dehydrogenase family protein n=1 Tax=Halobellus captivus TaxID=2592614 RepID=UPI00119CD857|nr:aldehyde dehydrogenase family protein [Halobellus captivus]
MGQFEPPEGKLREEYGFFIDGKPDTPVDRERFETVDPSTEQPLVEISAGTEADVDRAVSSARQALDEWRATSATERGQVLFQIADAIRDHSEMLAVIEALESGKPYTQAVFSIKSCIDYFEYFAGLADKVQGDTIPMGWEYVDFTIREPMGVTAHITPWNFPTSIIGRSIAPALAFGNTVVHKPAEETSISALEVARLAVDAGLPPGVFNVVPGRGTEAGAALAGHRDIDSLTFTGSVETGREVARLAVDNVAAPHLELGGKSPHVIFPDADFDAAVPSILRGIFSANSGQSCTAGSRLLVHQDIHDELVDRVVAAASELTLGPPMDDPDMGPLVSAAQYERVTDYIEIGREEVGEPIIGGAPDRTGYYVEPTIFDGVSNDSRIAREEIFGPVLTVIEFSDESEALEIANDTDYGLAAGIFTSDVGRALRFARNIQAGSVFVNEYYAFGTQTPHGGFKQSGIGREKGLEAIRTYTQTKNVGINIEV